MEFFNLDMSDEIAATNNIAPDAAARGGAGGETGSGWLDRFFTVQGHNCTIKIHNSGPAYCPHKKIGDVFSSR